MAFVILRRIHLSPPSRPKPTADNPNLSLFFSFSSSSVSQSPPSDQNQIVSDVVTLLTHHRFKSRWNHLRALLSDHTPLSSHDFSQIALQLKSNPRLALSFFDFTQRRRNSPLCSHDAYSFSAVIHLLARARLKSPAQSVIRTALLSRQLWLPDDEECRNVNPPLKLFEVLVKTYRMCDSAPFVFDLLIKSCLELTKIDESLEIVRKLRSRGISPQISTCNSLISRVSKCRGAYAGYDMFMELFESESEALKKGKRGFRNPPNVQSFNLLMEAFYRDGEPEMVNEIWLEMEKFGCQGNELSYSVLLAVYSETRKMSEAMKTWEAMLQKGIKPGALAYNTMIGGFCNVGDSSKAEEFFREMEMSGVEAGSSGISYEHLINVHCRNGDVDTAMVVYRDMVRKGFRPAAATIEVLIGGLYGERRCLEGLEVMRFCMKDVSFFPSGKSYEFLIKGLCEDGDEDQLEEARKLQGEMVGKGYGVNADVYGAFVEGYSRAGNGEMAARLKEEMRRVLDDRRQR
ncbi:Pentatricopeptide repeat-containing protein At2g15980 [Linum grandiflorum]